MRERKSSRVVVVINPGAGKGQPKELTHHLSQRFQSVGLTPHIVVARNGAEMIEAGRLATQEKPAVVVAGGGDGTINAVASALVDTGIPLGVLPLGTLNDFAKDLHIPLELEAAIGSIIAGHDRVALGRQAVVGAIDFGDGVRCIVFQPVFWGLDRGRVKQAGVDQRFLGPGAGTCSCRWDLTSAFSLVAGNASAIVASGTSYLTISARRFQRTVPGGASPLPSQLGRK